MGFIDLSKHVLPSGVKTNESEGLLVPATATKAQLMELMDKYPFEDVANAYTESCTVAMEGSGGKFFDELVEQMRQAGEPLPSSETDIEWTEDKKNWRAECPPLRMGDVDGIKDFIADFGVESARQWYVSSASYEGSKSAEQMLESIQATRELGNQFGDIVSDLQAGMSEFI